MTQSNRPFVWPSIDHEMIENIWYNFCFSLLFCGISNKNGHDEPFKKYSKKKLLIILLVNTFYLVACCFQICQNYFFTHRIVLRIIVINFFDIHFIIFILCLPKNNKLPNNMTRDATLHNDMNLHLGLLSARIITTYNNYDCKFTIEWMRSLLNGCKCRFRPPTLIH